MSRPLLQKMGRFVEFINSGDETIGQEVVSESAVFHVPFSDTPLKGLAGYMQILGMMRSAYPDIQWTLDDTVIEDDRVVAQFTLRGTHEGEFFGVPASGKKIQARAVNIYRFAARKIVEETGLPDLFGIMLQIGAVNPPVAH
ncbi:hypothetical protein Asppvi_003923 [Aspergillus pseudoviridinutans]|uniref:Ester cyclase n=1 Tax=Aspergillus pseudoviridinutans TaxID=1517512 RepID=A0A9P3BAX5_9EURO|nr:uncharacterized protein Asppvi_003923 [Aspergillus pseudoviridinutans]GIJ85068.1 hypothetical protein Asppvi_003923 [Aspergillus pseudoviridinutans]